MPVASTPYYSAAVAAFGPQRPRAGRSSTLALSKDQRLPELRRDPRSHLDFGVLLFMRASAALALSFDLVVAAVRPDLSIGRIELAADHKLDSDAQGSAIIRS